MNRATLERHQISLYLGAVLLGVLAAWGVPGLAWSDAVTPVLAALLYTTFLQVPLAELRRSLAKTRFLACLLAVNFGVAPVVAVLLLALMPGLPWPLHLGALMVLLAPCIDYVVVFTHLGRGDARLMLAATPLLLLVQMALLPLYLGVFSGAAAEAMMQPGPFMQAFLWLIAIPLLMAWLTQAAAARSGAIATAAEALGGLAVPLMALVLLVIVAAVGPEAARQAGSVALLVPLYVAFAVIMPLAGCLAGRLAGLPAGAVRAVAFSGGTRNSLVILPLAFAIPEAGPLLPAAIITQTLVELLAMPAYIRWIPRLLPD